MFIRSLKCIQSTSCCQKMMNMDPIDDFLDSGPQGCYVIIYLNPVYVKTAESYLFGVFCSNFALWTQAGM